jgi:hypothetical protein
MRAFVPQTTFELSQFLQLAAMYTTPSQVRDHLRTPYVNGKGIVFDLSLVINVFAVDDFYIPVRASQHGAADAVATQLWQVMTGKASLTGQLVADLDRIIDKSQQTSPELIEQLVKVVKRISQ